MNELTKRVGVAIIGIPFAIYTILNGGLLFSLTLLLISSLAMFEFQNLFSAKEIRINKIISYSFNILLFLLILAFINFNISNLKPITLIVMFHCIILFYISIVYFNQLWSKDTDPILNTASTLFSFLYITFSFICLLLIRNIQIISPNLNSISLVGIYDNSKSGYLLLSFFISIWTCDTFAYFIGKSFGKHKLFPRHSPKKSWEGAIAGFLGSILAFYYINTAFGINLKPIHSISIGVIIGIMGQIGDLFESHLKRWAGIKDSSNLIPGHGGFLDRFDSIIFTSPLILIYLLIVTL